MILIALPLCCILLYSVIFKDGIRVFDFVLRLYKDFNNSKRFARKKESNLPENAHGIFIPKNIIQYLEKNQYQGKRITIKSGTQTLYVQPASILYVQSQRNKTELVCFDKIITCNITIHKLLEVLPEEFYPLHSIPESKKN